MSNGPAHKLRYSGVEVTVWANQGNDSTFYTLSVSSNYKDKEDNWKNSPNVKANRALVAAELLTQAWNWIREQSVPKTESCPI